MGAENIFIRNRRMDKRYIRTNYDYSSGTNYDYSSGTNRYCILLFRKIL
jgi:hypothetical protein